MKIQKTQLKLDQSHYYDIVKYTLFKLVQGLQNLLPQYRTNSINVTNIFDGFRASSVSPMNVPDGRVSRQAIIK